MYPTYNIYAYICRENYTNNKHMRKLFTLLLLVAALTAAAQDTLLVGYCTREISTSPQVKPGSNKDIEAAICLTADVLAPYVGCQISGIKVGMPANGTLPGKVIGLVRVDSKTAEPAIQTDSVAITAGWNDILFAEPYTVTGQETGLYLSFRYHQQTALRCLSFTGEANANGAYIGAYTQQADGTMKVSWANVTTAMKGNLSLRAMVTGNVPHANLSLRDVRALHPVQRLGTDITVAGTVRNSAPAAAVNPVITYTLNGAPMGTYTLPQTLAYEDEAEFQITVPTTTITTDQAAEVGLQVAFADGTEDQFPADNVATAEVSMLKDVCYRRMVVEEGTGTWCGYCVRGYMGLKRMKEKYGDDHFIGIGVHNQDEFVYAAYDNWMGGKISGYPSALVNRDGYVYDPSFEELEDAYKRMDEISAYEVKATGEYVDPLHITAHADIHFMADTEHAMRVAFIVLEDSVMTTQANYYSGGSMGPMGGFENMDSHCDIPMLDAARYISNVLGDPQSEMSPAKKGDQHHIDTTIDLSKLKNKVVNTANTSLVVILIDQKTGQIVNGDKLERIPVADAIAAPRATGTNAAAVYDLQGRRVATPQHGLYIINGKKVAVK